MWKLRMQIYADKWARDLREWARTSRKLDWWDVLCWVVAAVLVIMTVVSCQGEWL